MKRAIAATGAVLFVVVVGCGGQPPDGSEVTAASTAPLESTALPLGAVCGLEYERPGSSVYGQPCEGENSNFPFPTNTICIGEVPPTTPAGFRWTEDGDLGLPTCNGFKHFTYNLGSQTASDEFQLPKGTACGFKETCNNHNETCLGVDPRVSCPAGWFRKIASDMNGASNCYYAWCEYQDPHTLCTTTACVHDNQPEGLVCGVTDSDSTDPGRVGQCMNLTTRTQGCPGGYNHFGNFDDGRSAGHGIGWCARDIGYIVQ
jgi:hypothetical protein